MDYRCGERSAGEHRRSRQYCIGSHCATRLRLVIADNESAEKKRWKKSRESKVCLRPPGRFRLSLAQEP